MFFDFDYLNAKKKPLPSDDDNNKKIEWTMEGINAVNEIMDMINTSPLMEPMGFLVQQYIEMESLSNDSFKDYTILINDKPIKDTDNLLLAFVCENYLKKIPSKDITRKKVYRAFGKIILTVIKDTLLYPVTTLQYKELYVVNLVNDVLVPRPTQLTGQIISSCYFLTKYLIYVLRYDNKYLLDFMETLLTQTQDLDITILTPEQQRNIKTVLDTKRTMHLRIFLLFSYNMIRERSPIKAEWFKKKLKLSDKKGFQMVTDDIVMETIICLVANKLTDGYNGNTYGNDYINRNDNDEESFDIK
jgi:hypothetical protein